MMKRAVADEKPDWKAKFVDRLHDPGRLRAAVTAAVLLVGYLGIYLPLSNEIEIAGTRFHHERKLADLACEIEDLRAQYRSFQGRLPKKSDPNEWVEYLLSGMRRLPLKLGTLNCDAIRDVGPYKAVVMRVELEGAFLDLEAFVRWLESNERLLRLDRIEIAPSRSSNEILDMQLTVLGVMG